jgi:DNA-directed RNA polymerase subunit RPC12/RpoP
MFKKEVITCPSCGVKLVICSSCDKLFEPDIQPAKKYDVGKKLAGKPSVRCLTCGNMTFVEVEDTGGETEDEPE